MTDLKTELLIMEKENERAADALCDACSLSDYAHLARGGVWTKALQRALDEHEVVTVPPSDTPYIVDETVVIPSNRKIVAYGATLLAAPDMDVIMMRNEHPVDQTHKNEKPTSRDDNITILGGTFDDGRSSRAGYGKSGKYDAERSFYGVSTCLLFNNLTGLTVKDATFAHCAAFALQAGEIENAVFRNIRFDDCYADGLHFGGNIKNILAVNVKGSVGDDLVALNMYDWQDSSVTFGAGETIWCEDLSLDSESKYKALRLESGIYKFDDGSTVDCALRRVVIKNVRGIRTFKLYLQTPPYVVGGAREWGECGSASDILFEDIDVELCAPIDKFSEYLDGDKVRGTFAAFELGANIENLTLKNIRLTLHRDEYPESRLMCIGPKSIVRNGKEVFDPYLSPTAKNVTLDSVTVNGEKLTRADGFIKEISFDDVNGDGASSGKGKFIGVKVI